MVERVATVSVVVPVHNCASYVGSALDSVLAQTHEAYEIVVVDDGSTDDVMAALAQYAGRIYCIRQTQRGAAAARNVGIRQAQGEFLAFLDADDIWYPDRLALQVRAAQRFPDAGMVCSDFVEFDEGSMRTPSRMAASQQAVSWLHAHELPGEHLAYGPIYSDLLGGNWVHTSSVLIRRAVLERVGLFDEQLTRGEDYDLWLQVARRYEVLCVCVPLSGYRVRPESLSGPAGRRWFVWSESDALVLEKQLQLGLVPPDLVGLARRNLVRRYRGMGRALLADVRRVELRALTRKGLRHQPLDSGLWAFHVASYLPSSAMRAIRSLGRRGRAHGRP